jgi:hypothetical protein
MGKFDGYWVEAVKEQLLNTFGNREWLAANFSTAQVTDTRVAYALQYGGSKLLTPVDVLQKAEQLVTGLHHTYATRLQQYQRGIGAVTARLPGLIRPSMDADASKAFLDTITAEVAKVPTPIADGTLGPMFFGTWRAVFTENGVQDSREKGMPSDRAMPAITLDAVHKAAQLMVRQLDTIIAAPTQIPWVGVDMFGAGPWDSLDDVTRSKLDGLVGMDGRPGEYHDFIWRHYYEWGMLLQAVAQWLYLTCQPNND